MFNGPSTTAVPLEIGVVSDEEGMAIIHAMVARERARALEEWAERVDTKDLTAADTSVLRAIADLAGRREEVESELIAAVDAARKANRSWSEFGAMVGVSKQAAQRKYASKVSA